MSIRAKLIVAALINLLLLLALAGAAAAYMRQMNQSAEFLNGRALPALALANKIADVASSYQILQARHMAAPDSQTVLVVETQMDATERQLGDLLQEYAAKATQQTERDALDQIRANWDNLVQQTHTDFIPASRSKATWYAAKIFYNFKPQFDQITQSIDVLIGANRQQGEAAANEAQRAFTSALKAVVVVAIVSVMASAGVAWWLSSSLVRNVQRLIRGTQAIGVGDFERPVEVHSRDELGHLADAFNTMRGALITARAEVAEQQQMLEVRVADRTAEVQRALVDLREALNAQESLSQTLRDLQNPLVPITEGVVVLPLVGAFDSARAAAFQEELLRGIETRRAHIVVLDVTGLPVLDTLAAQTLMQAAAAAKLLGADIVLVGITPAVAQTIVGLGVDLRALHIERDLQSAVASVLGQAAQK